jgi:hypothetical protein
MSSMVGLLEFPCTAPGCSRAFASQHGLDVHRGSVHKDETPPANEESSSTRCDRNRLCRRPLGHDGRCFPRSASEVVTRRRGRRPPPAPGPEPDVTEPETPATIAANGSVRLGRHELEALADLLEGRAAHLRQLASSGQMFKLSEASS